MFPAYIFISVACLAVYAKKKGNDEKIDMKALNSNECEINDIHHNLTLR